MSEKSESKPNINVTPFIDILLVLLIIFMAISPLKPTRFEAKVPGEPTTDIDVNPNPYTLIVKIKQDSSIELNDEKSLGTISDSQKLNARLSEIFQKRVENRAYAEGMELRNDLTEFERIQKTVFIKAPRKLSYGEVIKVVDSVKLAGAKPISLQIDHLE
jgi:biopolymer transport protein ExbD